MCEKGGIPLPEINVKVFGLEVDAVWHKQRVIVELDGQAPHGMRLGERALRQMAVEGRM